MKVIVKIGIIVSVLFAFSCSSTKNIGSTVRDGSSFANAVVVNSISEEYEYVRNVCSSCQLLGQSLVYEKSKPYDVLEFKKSNGKIVSYYFDISNSYGKGF